MRRPTWNGRSRAICARGWKADRARRARTARRLAPPPAPLARLSFVLLRDRAGLAQIVVEDPAVIEAVGQLLPETVLEVEATVAASEQAPGGVELREPRFTVLVEPADSRRSSSAGPCSRSSCPTLLDHAPVALRHPRRASRVRDRRRLGRRLPRHARRGSASSRSRRRSSSPRRPRAAPTSSRSTTSAARRTSPRARSSTSRCWSACSSASTRSGRSSAPSRTTPSRHLAEYVSLDAELGFIEDHCDVMRVLREAIAGMVEACTSAPRPRSSCSASSCPWCRRRSRWSTSRTPACRRRRARLPGRRAARSASEHGSRLPLRHGLPDGQAAVLHPPRPGPARVLELVRPALPRARAGHRRPAAAPVRGLPRARWRRAAITPSPTRATSRRSGTACRRTAASRSGSSAGSPGSPARRTSAR